MSYLHFRIRSRANARPGSRPERRANRLPLLFLTVLAQHLTIPSAGAQRLPNDTGATSLDSLVAAALSANPMVAAAAARVEAARATVAPAGARPDPMLMAGVQNLPVSEPGFADFMTMKMVGIGQTIPFPGKLGLRTRAALSDLDAAQAQLDAAKLAVAREVRSAYYDLALATTVFTVVARSQQALADLSRALEARYAAGTATQPEILRVRVEIARLADDAAGLAEDRRVALARINASLDRQFLTPVRAVFPDRVVRLARADSGRRVTFASTALGARVADSSIPALDGLQALALRASPTLRAHEAMIAAQAARAELAAKEHLPDIDVTVQYGQRTGFSDMITATVSLPLPLQRRRKQDAHAAEVRAELAALQAEHHAEVNRIRAEIAALHSTLERDRSRLALYGSAVLPQARATLTSATAGYQNERVEFAALIDAQAAVFTYEIQYHRALADFAKTLAELEELVGTEVFDDDN